MAVEIEHYTDSQGRACMRLRKLGDDPPALSNVTPLRAGEVVARGMTPIEAARGTTRSAIAHSPVAPSVPVVHGVQQLTEAERALCKLMNVSEADFLAQRRCERSGAGGAGKWTSGAVNTDPLE